MQYVYQTVKTYSLRLYYWILDYAYVVYWQLRSIGNKKDLLTFYADKPKPISQSLDIVLIPGVYENWYFMQPVIFLLASHGYKVHIISSLGYNRGTIELMADSIGKYIQQHKLQDVVIIAHSKGGLIGKYLMLQDDGKKNIKGMIAINSPFSGSVYANILPLSTLRIFRPSSSIISLLQKDVESNGHIISIYSEFDPHVPSGSYLEGARNIKIPTSGHFRIINNKKVHKMIVHYLVDFSS